MRSASKRGFPQDSVNKIRFVLLRPSAFSAREEKIGTQRVNESRMRLTPYTYVTDNDNDTLRKGEPTSVSGLALQA